MSDLAEAVDVLTTRRGHIIETTMQALVPGYPRRRRLHDLESGIGDAFDAIMTCATQGRRLTEDDIPFIRPVVRNATLRGGSEAEILRAPLTFQRVLWETVVSLVGGTPSGDRSIVGLVPTILDYVESASQVTHEIHLEVSEALNSWSSIARFELAENLIAGSPPEPGVPLNLARRCGLHEQSSVLVIVARAVSDGAVETALPMAMRTLVRAAVSGGVEPLAVVRDDEIVIIRATRHTETAALANAMEHARRQWEDDDLSLAIATSTVHDDLSRVPAAYEEACLALESLGDRPGFLALATVSALDYLMLRAGRSTAWRLVPDRIRTFVSSALSGEQALIDTLLTYVDCDLNVKRAAERLYVHPNTAHYRLNRIAERTGCNLRSFDDLEQLVIAVKLGEVMRAS